MIEVKNLIKEFNEVTALDGISLQVNEGEVFAYLGPNGAGKTTTVNILATLLKPTTGKATVAGYDVTKDDMEIRRLIGYLPEDFGLYPNLTVYENLNFAAGLYKISRGERKDKIGELLEFFDLREKKDVLASTLSKGMKQKVGIARAMINNPEILFLDEPTSGLDPGMAREVLKIILRLKEEGKTIFMTTHLLARAEQVCDSIALIDKGKILCAGKISDIKTKLKAKTLEDVYFGVMGENYE
ncbi:MAG TPA: ABC transporter ATP-binding protein [Candidatus Atribacteria bacterium]|nr:ABC transporter ATP-binding protein [Candidatus Atribacteria bacterium]